MCRRLGSLELRNPHARPVEKPLEIYSLHWANVTLLGWLVLTEGSVRALLCPYYVPSTLASCPGTRQLRRKCPFKEERSPPPPPIPRRSRAQAG